MSERKVPAERMTDQHGATLDRCEHLIEVCERCVASEHVGVIRAGGVPVARKVDGDDGEAVSDAFGDGIPGVCGLPEPVE